MLCMPFIIKICISGQAKINSQGKNGLVIGSRRRIITKLQIRNIFFMLIQYDVVVNCKIRPVTISKKKIIAIV